MTGTRCQFLVGTAGLAAGLALTASGAAQESTPASPASSERPFTDDNGVTVTLPAQPERIVADVNAAASLWDFGIRPVAVLGWNATDTGDFGDAGGNIAPVTGNPLTIPTTGSATRHQTKAAPPDTAKPASSLFDGYQPFDLVDAAGMV